MNKPGRREFIGTALAFAAALKAAEPSFAFPAAPRERLAVSTYPFRQFIISPHGRDSEQAKGGMRLEEFAASVREKLNVPGIEPWSRHFDSVDADYVSRLGDAFKRAGLRVVNIPVDVGVRLCATPEQREQGLATYRKWVDAAVILGSPSIRVHLPRGEKGDEIGCSVDSLGALAKYGESKNIVVNVENDDPGEEQPERIVRVLKTVNSIYLRSLPDFCNSMLIHNDQSYNNQALSTLFPLAFNISHVKDMESDENKTYTVDVDQIFAIAKKAGYRGFFSMEFEGKGDPYEGTMKLIAASLKNLS